MPRGPTIDPEVRQRISFLATQDIDLLAAKEIRERIKNEYPSERIPKSISAVQKIAREARRNRNEELDRPWSLAAYRTSPRFAAAVPSEMASDLMEVSLTCKLRGEPFTVRHAIWAGRVLPVVRSQMKWTHYLAYVWARRYSWREQHAEQTAIRRKPKEGSQYSPPLAFDTADLDARLALGNRDDFREWLYANAVSSGAVPPFPMWASDQEIGASTEAKARKGWHGGDVTAPAYVESRLGFRGWSLLARAALMAYKKPPSDLVYTLWPRVATTRPEAIIMEWGPDDTERPRTRDDVRPPTVEQVEAAGSVYALWLVRISRTEQWETLTLEGREEVRAMLSEEVIFHSNEMVDIMKPRPGQTMSQHVLSFGGPSGGVDEYMSKRESAFLWIPTKTMEQFGIVLTRDEGS